MKVGWGDDVRAGMEVFEKEKKYGVRYELFGVVLLHNHR